MFYMKDYVFLKKCTIYDLFTYVQLKFYLCIIFTYVQLKFNLDLFGILYQNN